LFVLYVASRTTPWILNRQLKGWDLRLDELEAEWNRVRGDLNLGLEQLEQLDASVKKHRQKVTQERVRLEAPGAAATADPLLDLRRRAGMVG